MNSDKLFFKLFDILTNLCALIENVGVIGLPFFFLSLTLPSVRFSSVRRLLRDRSSALPYKGIQGECAPLTKNAAPITLSSNGVFTLR